MAQDDWNDGASRPARDWLAFMRWKLPDPTPEDLRDLDKVMEYDEFWEWSGGKVEWPTEAVPWWAYALAGVVVVVCLFQAFIRHFW